MKIRITNEGFLKIERAGKFKSQLCPHDQEDARCGDWCPLFDEPCVTEDGKCSLYICQRSFLTKPEDFEDQRLGGTDE